jgi:hypothetical protein
VLNAEETYVRKRAAGPARISLSGRNYTVHPEQPDGVKTDEPGAPPLPAEP